MKNNTHVSEINFMFIRNVILLGDLFGVSIQKLAFEDEKKRTKAYFLDENGEKGYAKAKKNGTSFVLHSKIGEITGWKAPTLAEHLTYSLSVEGKPYDTLKGFYLAYENEGNLKQSISLYCEKEKVSLYEMKSHQDLANKEQFVFSKQYQDEIGRALKDEFIMSSKKPYAYKFERRAKMGQKYETQFLIASSLEDEDSCQLGTGFYSQAVKAYQKYRRDLLKEMHTELTFEDLDLYQNFVTANYEARMLDEEPVQADVIERITGVRPKEYQKNRAFVKQLQQ